MWLGLISFASWGWTQDEIYPMWIIGTIAFVLGWVLKRLQAVANIFSDDGIGGVLRLIFGISNAIICRGMVWGLWHRLWY